MSNPVAAVTEDDGSRSYVYPPTGEAFPSVTTVLSATEGKPWLQDWAAKLAAEYAVDHYAALGGMARMEGRDSAVAHAAREGKRLRDLKRDTGGYVHDVVEALVLWQASPEGAGAELALPLIPEHIAGMDYDGTPVEDVADAMTWGFLNWVADFSPRFEASEMTVYNPALRVAGTLDGITWLPGLTVGRAGRFIPGSGVRPCIDVKTGKYLDATVPEQIAAYRRMTVCRLPMDELEPMPATDCGAVLHLRPEFERGYRFMLISGADDAAAWNRFRRARELFDGRKAAKAKPGKVCYPLRADGTIRQPRLADLDGEGYGRAPGALAKAGVEDLEQLAAMTAGQLLACKGIGGKTVEATRVLLADHGLHLAGEAREVAALWPCSTYSGSPSRSAGSALASRSRRQAAACGRRSWTRSGSPPRPVRRLTRSPSCTAGTCGTGSGASSRSSRPSP